MGRKSWHDRVAAFRWAWEGLRYLWRTQPHARFHGLATLLVVALGLWLRLDALRWALVWGVVGLVWMAEAFNTALEAVVDLVSPEPHPLARVSKDVAAGAVLLAAFTAMVVGGCVFGPLLWQRLMGR